MRTINLAAMLTVAGGLAAANLPSAARANCSPSVSTGGRSAGGVGNLGGYVSGQEVEFNPEAEYQNGLKAFDAGDFRRAKAAFSRLLPYADGQAPIYYLAGASRIGLGDYKGAVKLLEKAVKLDPAMLIAQQDLGIAYARTGDLPRAKEMLATMEAKATQCGGACDSAEPLQVAIDAVKEAMAA